MIDAVKELETLWISSFHSDQIVVVLKEIIVDFLYRLKDKHPYSNPKMREAMDVFDLIMEFLIPNWHLPSIFLLKEYIESEFTKKFNTLSTLKYFNKKQDEYHQISEVDYERLRSWFDSRPPIVFYFNPKMQIQEYVKDGYLNIGFKGSKGVSTNILLRKFKLTYSFLHLQSLILIAKVIISV